MKPVVGQHVLYTDHNGALLDLTITQVISHDRIDGTVGAHHTPIRFSDIPYNESGAPAEPGERNTWRFAGEDKLDAPPVTAEEARPDWPWKPKWKRKQEAQQAQDPQSEAEREQREREREQQEQQRQGDI